MSERKCQNCGTTVTTQWRTLGCNACALHYKRTGKYPNVAERELPKKRDRNRVVGELIHINVGGRQTEAYKCRWCDYVSTKKFNVRKHEENHHVAEDQSPPPTTSGSAASAYNGMLIGRPLDLLCPNNTLPKVLFDLFRYIYTHGVAVEGIFSQQANQDDAQRLWDTLDSGEEVIWTEHSPILAVATLKEVLRNLPNKLLVRDMYYEWTGVCDRPGAEERLELLTMLLSVLPPVNYQMLRYVLCVLHQVVAHRETNRMNSRSLAAMVGASLIERPPSPSHSYCVQDVVQRVRIVAQLLIENVETLCGRETLELLNNGAETPQPEPAPWVLPEGIEMHREYEEEGQ